MFLPMFFVGLLLSTSLQASEPACLRGQAGKADFIEQMKKAKDPLSEAFKASRVRPQTFESDYCVVCTLESTGDLKLKAAMAQSADIMRNLRPNIKPACIAAALQRDVGGTGNSCAGAPDFTNTAAETPCVTQELSEFIAFTVNQAMVCLGSDLDARWILKKLNADSGFQFWSQEGRRRGLGRFPDPLQREVAGWTSGPESRRIPGSIDVLAKLQASQNPECAPFKKILEKDVPVRAGESADQCRMLSMGEGLARNVIYSLGAFIDTRDRLKKDLSSRAPQVVTDFELLNQLTLLGESANGAVEVEKFLNSQRLGLKSDPAKVQKALRDHPVLADNASKHREMLRKLNPGREVFSDKEKDGSSCVGQ